MKSRTWSRRDARDKAAVITELLALFGASPDDTLSDGYVELVAGGGSAGDLVRWPSGQPGPILQPSSGPT